MVEEKLKEKEMKKENPEKVERPKEWPNPLKEMRENALILENKKFIEKYGLSKKKFEIHIEVSLKFNNSFQIVADYLRYAGSLINGGRVKECGHFIERAKYVLKGCKDNP